MKINNRKELLVLLNTFFGVNADEYEFSYIWTLVNPQFQDFIVITLSFDSSDNSYNDNLISEKNLNSEENIILNVQTSQGVFELHNCKNFKIIEPDEIFFWVEENKSTSLMIIGKQATCSVFSNIANNILARDITELNPNEVLASVQISMIQNN